ncbi:hypothetical protein FZC66_06725 [Priestia megaterium]|nr:hypothetical protein FZC66_06725 [Priestia megaterium]
MNGQQLLYGLLTSKGEGLRAAYVLCDHRVIQADLSPQYQAEEHVAFQQSLMEKVHKLTKQPEVDMHLQLLLHMAKQFQLPVSHTTTNGELYELSDHIGNLIVSKYNELFSIARCHSLEDVMRHQIRLFFHLVDSQYMIAPDREQALLQQQLMNWIEQLTPLYKDRIIDVLEQDYRQEALSKVLQTKGTLELYKQLPPHAYEAISSLLCTVMNIFAPVSYSPSLLFSMNAPLWMMANLESHEIIAKKKEAEPFLPVLLIAVQLIWTCKLEHQDELLNYQSLLIKWSSVYTSYRDFLMKKEQALFDCERLDTLIYDGEQHIKQLRTAEKKMIKQIEVLKTTIRHQLDEMDLKTLNSGLVMQKMIEEHESLKQDVEELQRKFSIKGDFLEKVRLALRSAERVVKSKVKEVERKKVLMQMTDFILASRLPVCVDIQNEIHDLQDQLATTVFQLNQQVDLLDEMKQNRQLTEGKLRRYESEIKRLERTYYGLKERHAEVV